MAYSLNGRKNGYKTKIILTGQYPLKQLADELDFTHLLFVKLLFDVALHLF